MSGVPLSTLLAALPGHTIRGDTDPVIAGIAYHSGRVQPGFLFAAIRGAHHDGHTFIPEALRRGASAVLVQRPVAVPPDVPQILVADTRAALGALAAAFYGYPADALTVIGVTGTNGKGVTTFFIDAVLRGAGYRSAIIGTMGVWAPAGVIETDRTTPEAPDLQHLLAALRDQGVTHVAAEVASHALALHRVDGTRFRVAVFTNLTPDHLDFHGTWEAYLGAKRRLFTLVDPQGWSVVNAADPAAEEMARASRAPVRRFALHGGGRSGPPGVDLWAEEVVLDLEGCTFRATTAQGSCPVRLHIGGAFNVANALAALATGMALGVPLEAGAAALETVRGVPGRFEPVQEGQDFAVIVDYAHTPDGLENVLRTARQITRGRVVVVFGCGGDRDRAKRPMMGRLAVELADLAVVTSDNPRSEEPVAIIDEILQGIRATAGEFRRARVEVEPDRRAAIHHAIAAAAPGDIVIIAGKGHETYQEVCGVRHPFDDRVVAREALRARQGSVAP